VRMCLSPRYRFFFSQGLSLTEGGLWWEPGN